MPSITPGKTTNPVQPNATSLDQNRRNWQRLSRGGVNGLVSVTAPITNTGGSLGLSFQSSVFTVVGGVFSFTLLTTKGDLATYGTGPTRLPIGTDGQVLTANSSATNGVDWETPSGGGVPVTGPFEYANTNPLTDSSSNLYYSNTSILADSSGSLYYGLVGEGAVFIDNTGSLYFVNQNVFVDPSGNIYNSQGYLLFDGSTFYYISSGQPAIDSMGNVHFANGDIFASSGGNIFCDGFFAFYNAITAPTTSNSMYVDSADSKLKFRQASGVITVLAPSSPSVTFVDKEIPTGTINGSNTVFTLANSPTAGSEQVIINGLILYPGIGNDYTISGTTLTFLTGAIPQTGDRLFVNYRH